jgi:hypothetical protein
MRQMRVAAHIATHTQHKGGNTLFRTTFLTGEARCDGSDWYHVTAYIDDEASNILDAVEFRTNPKGIVVDIDATTAWKSGAGARHRKMAVVRSDGRRSATRMSMFFSTDADFLIKGKVGRTETTTQFIDHMLAVGGERDWHGETSADRIKDAGIIRAYLAALDS